MAPVFGDCVDGGGVALKSVKADPDGEIVKFRRPGRAMLNSTWAVSMKPKQKDKSKTATGRPTRPSWQEMSRKQRREMMRKIQSEELSLEVIHPDAAGIDIGNESHYVAVPPSRDSQPVRRFGCTTAELKVMAGWLHQCGIRTIAMQSTGMYWIAVYDILEEAGFEVYLVNARETKNLPGRKTDVQESQWLMKLHTYGLLRNSFRPPQEIRTMRTYWRQRNDLVQAGAWHIQRIQKALTQMNIQLANVLSDMSGMTGQAIIKAMLTGERDPHELAQLRDPRVKASEEQVERSLDAPARSRRTPAGSGLLPLRRRKLPKGRASFRTSCGRPTGLPAYARRLFFFGRRRRLGKFLAGIPAKRGKCNTRCILLLTMATRWMPSPHPRAKGPYGRPCPPFRHRTPEHLETGHERDPELHVPPLPDRAKTSRGAGRSRQPGTPSHPSPLGSAPRRFPNCP